MKRTILVLFFVLFLFGTAAHEARSQTGPKSVKIDVPDHLKTSPAFGELILRRVELESTLAELLESYTDEYPKVKETRFELDTLRKDISRIVSVSAKDSGKLTLALGKLIVRKAAVATDHWVLLNRFSDEHPRVKRAKKKLQIFEDAISEIL